MVIVLTMPFTQENALSHTFLREVPEPFEEEIVRQANSIPTYPYLDLDVRSSIDALQHRLEDFYTSPHPDDKRACAKISRRFHEYDAAYVPPRALSVVTMGRDLIPWLATANYPEAVSLLTWNAERLARHQERLNQDVPALQEIALQNIGQAAGFGIVRPIAKKLAGMMLRGTKFMAIDSFEAGLRNADGYLYYNGQTPKPFTIALANAYEGGPLGLDTWQPRYPYTATHETWHAVWDGMLGGMNSILNPHRKCAWWGESEVEHATQVGFHGEPDITSPELRTYKGGTYLSCRELGHVIKTGGEVQISQTLIGEASLEPLFHSELPLKARKELDRLLRLSFRNVIDLGESDMNIVELIGSQTAQVPRAHRDRILDSWRQKLPGALGVKGP